jgi:hypothetical protein
MTARANKEKPDDVVAKSDASPFAVSSLEPSPAPARSDSGTSARNAPKMATRARRPAAAFRQLALDDRTDDEHSPAPDSAGPLPTADHEDRLTEGRARRRETPHPSWRSADAEPPPRTRARASRRRCHLPCSARRRHTRIFPSDDSRRGLPRADRAEHLSRRPGTFMPCLVSGSSAGRRSAAPSVIE